MLHNIVWMLWGAFTLGVLTLTCGAIAGMWAEHQKKVLERQCLTDRVNDLYESRDRILEKLKELDGKVSYYLATRKKES